MALLYCPGLMPGGLRAACFARAVLLCSRSLTVATALVPPLPVSGPPLRPVALQAPQRGSCHRIRTLRLPGLLDNGQHS
jgi:hypothetical protein